VFGKPRALFPDDGFAWLSETQPDEWAKVVKPSMTPHLPPFSWHRSGRRRPQQTQPGTWRRTGAVHLGQAPVCGRHLARGEDRRTAADPPEPSRWLPSHFV